MFKRAPACVCVFVCVWEGGHLSRDDCCAPPCPTHAPPCPGSGLLWITGDAQVKRRKHDDDDDDDDDDL